MRWSNLARRLWRGCCVGCCAAAVAYVFAGDPPSVLVFAASGIAFFMLGEWRYPDLGDDL